MDDDQETVVGDIGDFEELFQDAPPFEVSLTFDEIKGILNAIQVAVTYAVMLEEDFDREPYIGIRDKFQAKMQEYLDSPPEEEEGDEQ